MSAAEQIGLLPGFGWIAGHGMVVTLLLCLMLTPVGHCLVGIICESRWVPLTSRKQFLSFFPGDIFLGLMAAVLLVLAQSLPHEQRWYNSLWWHIAVLVSALVVAVVMTWAEWRDGVYPSAAIFSPTKIYHNFLLYGGYGYVIVTTLVAVAAAARSWGLVLALLSGLVWVGLLVVESFSSDEVKQSRAKYAHVPDWEPWWRLP